MFRSLIIAGLSIAVIGVSYWGYKEHEEKTLLLIQAENNYQRSFHELSYNMDLLHDKIATSLAMNSRERLSPQFVDIWRITSEALTNVGQLPLQLLPFNKTESFLSQIGDFTYRTAVRDLDDDPLTDEEMATLEKLYKQSSVIKKELRQVQHDTLANDLRWMDVELELATNSDQTDNSIIDGFQTVEKKVGEFSEGDEGVSLLQTDVKDHAYRYIKGKKKSEEEIRNWSKKLFSISDADNIKISKTGKGADVPMYTVTYEDGKRLYMDITEKGGHPVSILVDREIKEAKLSLHDGQQAAEKYLKQFDYKNMHVYETQQFDRVGVYAFVYQDDDRLIYPDTVVIKVALDNGDIIGMNAHPYLMNHHDRKLNDPKLSLEKARTYVNENLKIEEEQLALIENDLQEEVLTYEFIGQLGDETYRIFINAENGTEEKVERMSSAEIRFE